MGFLICLQRISEVFSRVASSKSPRKAYQIRATEVQESSGESRYHPFRFPGLIQCFVNAVELRLKNLWLMPKATQRFSLITIAKWPYKTPKHHFPTEFPQTCAARGVRNMLWGWYFPGVGLIRFGSGLTVINGLCDPQFLCDRFGLNDFQQTWKQVAARP